MTGSAGAGYAVLPWDPATANWADAALTAARQILSDPSEHARHMRHDDTWFVGVDALPNEADGSIGGAALTGPWQAVVKAPQYWHRAQLSAVFRGYPRRDPQETAAQHRYRVNRFGAHVDGLLPIGPDRRRYLREPHAFVLGLPLNTSDAAPLMVWPGSHRILGDAFRAKIGARAPEDVDLTDCYQTARRRALDLIEPVPIVAGQGASILLHRHLLHGIAPWQSDQPGPDEGRIIAYFRPHLTAGGRGWLSRD